MTWMLSSTGAAIDLRFVAADQISILDVGHHLAQINRFDGAARRPISVAEHSLVVVEILERECFLSDPSILLAALMHDAHEYITGDMKTPMKQLLGAAWQEIEDRIQRSVMRRFNLVTAFHSARVAIHWADMTALASERKALLPDTGPEWPVMRSHNALEWIDYEGQARFTWQDWREAFLDRFAELSYARSLQADDLGRENT